MRQNASRWALAVVLLGTAGVSARLLAAKSKPPPVANAASAAASAVRAEGQVISGANAEALVSAESVGRVVNLLANEGDLVQRDQVLAELNSDEARAALAEARARAASVATELRWATADLARDQELAKTGSLSRSSLDVARRRVDTLRADLVTLEAVKRRVNVQLDRCSLRAPIAGRVIRRTVRLGETVPAGAQLFVVADVDRLRIEAEVDEFDVSRVELGGSVSVRPEGDPSQTYRGRISEIPRGLERRRLRPEDPALAPAGNALHVKVELLAPSGLMLGQRVELTFEPRP